MNMKNGNILIMPEDRVTSGSLKSLLLIQNFLFMNPPEEIQNIVLLLMGM